MRTDRAHLLIVEDDPISRGLLHSVLAGAGYEITDAGDCAAARRAIAGDAGFDAIVLDRHLPDGDALQLIPQIRASPALRDASVIVQTVRVDTASIGEGIAAGAFHYLAKPVDRALLLTVVGAALAASRERRSLRQGRGESPGRAMALLDRGTFHFRTIDDATQLARAIAARCPGPAEAVLVLQELLVNAVEHGNLGIGYEEKSRLLLVGGLHEEIERRLADPVLGARQARVELLHADSHVAVTIADQGPGFDWRRYLELSPERAFDAHGRGIAMACASGVDALEFTGSGNVVTATWRRSRH